MERFDYVKGIYVDDDVTIKSSDIACVEEFHIDVEMTPLYVVGVKLVNGEWYYYCNSQETFLNLEKAVAEKKDIIKDIILGLEKEWGAKRFFWKKVIYCASESYGFNYSSYLESIFEPEKLLSLYAHYVTDTWREKYNDFYLYSYDARKIQIFFYVKQHDKKKMDELYENFLLLLPQNLERGIEKKIKERIIEDKEFIIKRYGSKFEYKEQAVEEGIQEWEKSYKEDGLRQMLISILDEIKFWEDVSERGYDTSDFTSVYLNILNEEKILIKNRYFDQLALSLENEHGLLENRKKELISDLRKIDFEEGVNLYKLFQANCRSLKEKAKEVPIDNMESPYDKYIEFFEMGSIQISATLNKINKYKSRKKTIPQADLDKSLLYFFDAESITEAQKEQEKQTYLQNRKNGTIGEKEVEYALKWLDKDYLVVDKNSIGKYGEKTIVLNNPTFVDEPQEYDHIIIGKQGVFLIETKNYAGKLIVDSQGNWIRIRKDGTEEGERNPLQQIRRHEKILKSILPQDVPIISIICMAHPKMIIEGSENCIIPIVKSDLLVEFIESYNSSSELSMENMQKCLQTINEYMI